MKRNPGCSGKAPPASWRNRSPPTRDYFRLEMSTSGCPTVRRIQEMPYWDRETEVGQANSNRCPRKRSATYWVGHCQRCESVERLCSDQRHKIPAAVESWSAEYYFARS